MLKTRKRWVSLLVAVVMVAGLLVPFVGPASAMCTYNTTSVVNVTAGGAPQDIGAGEITFDIPTWDSIGTTNGSVYADLPSTPGGFANADPALYSAYPPGSSYPAGTTIGGVDVSGQTVPVTSRGFYVLPTGATPPAGYPAVNDPEQNSHGSDGIINGYGAVILTGSDYQYENAWDLTKTEGVPQQNGQDYIIPAGYYPRNINVTVIPYAAQPVITGNPSNVTLELTSTLWIPSGVTGTITQTLAAPSSSVFTAGSGPIAIVGNATLTVAAESTPAISSAGGAVGIIDVTENAAGALASGGNPGLKLTLPPGFTWETNPGQSLVEYMWGTDDQGLQDANNIQTNIADLSNDGRELDIYDQATKGSTSSTGASTTAQFIKINAGVSVDEATAETGNITVTLGGQTSANVSTLVVGSYGSFGTTCAASGTAPTIVAGEQGSTIGELEVKEGIPGSIVYGRTITLTLPTDVAWSEYPTLDTTLSTNTGSGVSAFSNWTEEGTNGNQIQCTVGTSTLGTASLAGPTSGQTEPGDFFFKNMEVTPAVDFSGPLTVTVGGSEGLTGTVTLATIGAPVTVAAASTPTVGIGTSGQTLGDMTITEVAAGDIGSVGYYSGLVINSAVPCG